MGGFVYCTDVSGIDCAN